MERRRSAQLDCSPAPLSRAGTPSIDGYAEDYAYLIFGLLELFQADADPAWLEWAIALQRRQDELFWDESAGGWFSTTGRDPSVLAADERGLRRRRADGERRLGDEPPGVVAPGRRCVMGQIASSARCGCSARGWSRWDARVPMMAAALDLRRRRPANRDRRQRSQGSG